MTKQSEKRCGNCRWYKSWNDLGNGDCWAPIPWSAESVHKHHMRDNDGSHCPCHAPREKSAADMFREAVQPLDGVDFGFGPVLNPHPCTSDAKLWREGEPPTDKET